MAEKKKAGRPSKYDPKYCNEILKYFAKKPMKKRKKKILHQNGSLKSEEIVLVPQLLPTFNGFAAKIGVSRDTLLEWCKHPEFSDAYARAREMQEEILIENALMGLYNPQFAQFFAKNNLGYKDRQEMSVTDRKTEVVLEGLEKYAD